MLNFLCDHAIYWIRKRFHCLKAYCLCQAGHNGTINGQGQTWWTKYQKKLLNHTRGPLLQLMWSRDIVISNITLRDSPFWTLHPYDCKNVTISNLTILAPVSGAPNTDGIDPGKHVSLCVTYHHFVPVIMKQAIACTDE